MKFSLSCDFALPEVADIKNLSVNQKDIEEKENMIKNIFLLIQALNWIIKFSKSFPEMNRDANQLKIEGHFKRECFWSVRCYR